MFEKMAFGRIQSRDEFPIANPDEYKTATFGKKLTTRYIKQSLKEAFKAIGQLGM
jgi:hypothetical protein